jgi:hypothetical protein
MGRCHCPEKRRRRGEEAGAEDEECWGKRVRSDAAEQMEVGQAKAAILWRLARGVAKGPTLRLDGEGILQPFEVLFQTLNTPPVVG